MSPLALTQEFADDPVKQRQWIAFLKRTGLDAPEDLGELIKRLNDFLLPFLRAAGSLGATASRDK